MVKAGLDELKRTSLTLDEISLLDLTLELPPEDITLIFPWGSSLVSLRRSSNYLQYCMELPMKRRSLAIMRLLGLKPYPRSWWTRSKASRRRFTNAWDPHPQQLERDQRTGTMSTNST